MKSESLRSRTLLSFCVHCTLLILIYLVHCWFLIYIERVSKSTLNRIDLFEWLHFVIWRDSFPSSLPGFGSWGKHFHFICTLHASKWKDGEISTSMSVICEEIFYHKFVISTYWSSWSEVIFTHVCDMGLQYLNHDNLKRYVIGGEIFTCVSIFVIWRDFQWM